MSLKRDVDKLSQATRQTTEKFAERAFGAVAEVKKLSWAKLGWTGLDW